MFSSVIKWRMPLKKLHTWRKLFLSILYKRLQYTFSTCSEPFVTSVATFRNWEKVWFYCEAFLIFFLWLSVIRKWIYFRSTFLVLKKERNHVWFSDQSEANRKMNEQKWNAVLMAIENLIQVFCNNTAIIGKDRIWKFKFFQFKNCFLHNWIKCQTMRHRWMLNQSHQQRRTTHNPIHLLFMVLFITIMAIFTIITAKPIRHRLMQMNPINCSKKNQHQIHTQKTPKQKGKLSQL